MQRDGASGTAIVTAYLRAAHQVIDPGPRVFDDPLSVRLLGPDAEKMIRDNIDNYMTPDARKIRAHVVLRARYVEERLRLSAGRGLGQYVILGAGLDTFPYRQPAWASSLRIFEVDHPRTQELKRKKIRDAGIGIPGNVFFAGIDFERESLEECLSGNGVLDDTKTIFSWLGVTMYLTEPAVVATLKCMSRYPRGSEAVVTFRQPPSGHDSLAEHVSRMGEPYLSYFTPDGFKEKLLEAGFSRAGFLAPELSARYFHDDNNTLENPKLVNIVSAIV